MRGRIERMRTATISEAKQRLEELIAAARAGEEVQITDGGRPVASLTSSAEQDAADTTPHRHATTNEMITEMVRKGLLIPSSVAPDASWLDDLPPGESGALAALLEEREEGW